MSDYMEYAEYYKKAWENSLKERASELQAEIMRLREALEFYALSDKSDEQENLDFFKDHDGEMRSGYIAIKALNGGNK